MLLVEAASLRQGLGMGMGLGVSLELGLEFERRLTLVEGQRHGDAAWPEA